MSDLTYSITIQEEISNEEFSFIAEEFKRFFEGKGFTVESIQKKSGSTIIIFGLGIPETALVLVGGSIVIFIIKAICKNILDDIYKKFKSKFLGKKIVKVVPEKYSNNTPIKYEEETEEVLIALLAGSKDKSYLSDISTRSFSKDFEGAITILKRVKKTKAELKLNYADKNERFDMTTTLNLEAKKKSISIYYEGPHTLEDEND